MSIIIVGFIVFFLGFIAAKADPSIRPFSFYIKMAGIILMLVGFSISSVVQVEPGQVGVKKL